MIEFMCPMGLAERSGELDTAVLYLASDASTYTTDQIIIVDGGWTTINEQPLNILREKKNNVFRSKLFVTKCFFCLFFPYFDLLFSV